MVPGTANGTARWGVLAAALCNRSTVIETGSSVTDSESRSAAIGDAGANTGAESSGPDPLNTQRSTAACALKFARDTFVTLGPVSLLIRNRLSVPPSE